MRVVMLRYFPSQQVNIDAVLIATKFPPFKQDKNRKNAKEERYRGDSYYGIFKAFVKPWSFLGGWSRRWEWIRIWSIGLDFWCNEMTVVTSLRINSDSKRINSAI